MNEQSNRRSKRARHEPVEDRTLYWTLSLYVDNDKLEHVDDDRRNPKDMSYEALVGVSRNSTELSDAIDPLMNDIADRERLDEVKDRLLDVVDESRFRQVKISMQDMVPWTTEGCTYEARFDEPLVGDLRMRRFWYLHRNGALSYHLSFTHQYVHTIRGLFFISMLQKLVAPKEFRVGPVTNGMTGVFPLDQTLAVETEAADPKASTEQKLMGKPEPFWLFVKQIFNRDFVDLIDRTPALEPALEKARPANAKVVTSGKEGWFDALVTMSQVVEVPGLVKHPCARSIFIFNDETFLKALQNRRNEVTDARFEEYGDKIRSLAEAATSDDVSLSESYWNWVRTGDDANSGDFDEARKRSFLYLFLAGFNQNIIDFMNQDASEVLDSTDPVYPKEEKGDPEKFFMRYANQRAILSYSRKSRSLEVGNDWIGTCPYVFLIHVITMHNEFLAREYEKKANKRVGKAVEKSRNDSAKSFGEKLEDMQAVAESFYEFNRTQYVEYMRYRYANVFRYDTEREMFEELEKIRGTARKSEYIDALVSNMQGQAHDREGQIMNIETRTMNRALMAISGLSILQTLYAAFAAFAKPGDFPNLLTRDLLLWITVPGIAISLVLVVHYVLKTHWT